MNPEELYSKLEKIEKLEEIIFERGKKKKLEIGDEHVIEYNRLVDSIPTLLSLRDLREYHRFLGEKTGNLLKEKLDKQKEELEGKLDEQESKSENNLYKQEEEILKALKNVCSSDVYSKIESVIENVDLNMIHEE